MSCESTAAQARLLDGYVGWDAAQISGEITGLTDTIGLRLKGIDDLNVREEVLARFIPPPWLASGCEPCQWYLLCTDAEAGPQLLERSRCRPEWRDILGELAGADQLRAPNSMAVSGHRVALADRGLNRVFIWDLRNGRRLAEMDVANPGPVGFSPWCELIVVQDPERGDQVADDDDTSRLLRFDLTGNPRGAYEFCTAGPVDRLAPGRDCAFWAAAESPHPLGRVFELTRVTLAGFEAAEQPADTRSEGGEIPEPPHGFVDAVPCCRTIGLSHTSGSAVGLRAAFSDLGLTVGTEGAFCIELIREDGTRDRQCFRRSGNANTDWGLLEVKTSPRSATLLTHALDSGLPRCRWHRVRLDAHIPAATGLSVEVATTEEDVAPHAADWQQADLNATDFLIQQPPGRYLHVKVILHGDGAATPVVHRAHLDFPRRTSLDQLPAIYRENREAEDFTERFLTLFDASTEEVDRSIERFSALLDPDGVPGEVLPWLGTFLGIVFDPGLSEARRRRLLQAAPRLYRRRGTPAGLVEAIELVFDVTPVIQEHVQRRAWGVLNNDARLRVTRLFGRAASRFRVGRSAMGAAPVRGTGNPDQDPFALQAHRFTVLIPPSAALSETDRQQLEQLVNSQKPAHTVHLIRFGGGEGFIVGPASSVGVDTMLRRPKAPILGSRNTAGFSGNIRLNRDSILHAGRRGCARFRAGESAVGIQTILE